MTAAALHTAPPSALAKAVADAGTMTGRHLRRLIRVPSVIAFATLQPVLLVLLFTYGFGGAVHPPGVTRYIDYLLRNLLVIGLMIAVGAAIGFRFHAGPTAAVAAVALAVATGLAFSWLNIGLGLLVRDPESAGLAGLFPVIILVFASSTLVPVATMPGWLQDFAKVNPVTVIAGALRVLCLGGPATLPVTEACAWIAGLLLITIPLAIRRYRHAASA